MQLVVNLVLQNFHKIPTIQEILQAKNTNAEFVVEIQDIATVVENVEIQQKIAYAMTQKSKAEKISKLITSLL